MIRANANRFANNVGRLPRQREICHSRLVPLDIRSAYMGVYLVHGGSAQPPISIAISLGSGDGRPARQSYALMA